MRALGGLLPRGRPSRDAGLEAEPQVVADAPAIPISETIVRVARERRSSAVVVGERARGRLDEVLLGSVSREVIRYAACRSWSSVALRSGSAQTDSGSIAWPTPYAIVAPPVVSCVLVAQPCRLLGDYLPHWSKIIVSGLEF